ncbi:hypothetical protein VPH35_101006 [Triticum aestivum]
MRQPLSAATAAKLHRAGLLLHRCSAMAALLRCPSAGELRPALRPPFPPAPAQPGPAASLGHAGFVPRRARPPPPGAASLRRPLHRVLLSAASGLAWPPPAPTRAVCTARPRRLRPCVAGFSTPADSALPRPRRVLPSRASAPPFADGRVRLHAHWPAPPLPRCVAAASRPPTERASRIAVCLLAPGRAWPPPSRAHTGPPPSRPAPAVSRLPGLSSSRLRRSPARAPPGFASVGCARGRLLRSRPPSPSRVARLCSRDRLRQRLAAGSSRPSAPPWSQPDSGCSARRPAPPLARLLPHLWAPVCASAGSRCSLPQPVGVVRAAERKKERKWPGGGVRLLACSRTKRKKERGRVVVLAARMQSDKEKRRKKKKKADCPLQKKKKEICVRLHAADWNLRPNARCASDCLHPAENCV